MAVRGGGLLRSPRGGPNLECFQRQQLQPCCWVALQPSL